jgi:hypothetical protein
MGNASALELFTPFLRVDRLTIVSDPKIDTGGAASPTSTDLSDHLARLDPFTGFLEQALIVTIKTHIAIAVIDDQQQTESAQPIRERDPPIVDRPHLLALRGLDQNPVPAQLAYLSAGTETGPDPPLGGPG